MINIDHKPLVASQSFPNNVFVAQRELIRDWITWLRVQVGIGQLSARTLSDYSKNIELWLTFLEQVAHTDRPTQDVVHSYVNNLCARYEPSTVNTYLAPVRSCYQWAETCDRYIAIGRGVKNVQKQRDTPLPSLSHEQIESLIKGYPVTTLVEVRNRALLAILYASALKAVSLELANVGDVDLSTGKLVYHPKGYGEKDAMAYLPTHVLEVVSVWISQRYANIGMGISRDDPLFCSLDRRTCGHRLTKSSIRRIVSGAMESAGHVRRVTNGRITEPYAFSAHSLRRSALMTIWKQFSPEAAHNFSGHACVETTKHMYRRFAEYDQLQEIAKIVEIPPPPRPMAGIPVIKIRQPKQESLSPYCHRTT